VVDSARFRQCLGRFATGVTVVSYWTDDQAPEHRGITVNAFSSVSLQPPLIVIAIARAARSHDLLAGRPFTVNVLTPEQEPIARHFAGDVNARPEVKWLSGHLAPRLIGVLAWMECKPWKAYEGGDHSLYVGEVVDFLFSDGEALGFFSSGFVPVARPIPSQPPLPYDPFELPYDAA
jgi:flavin reductase